MKNLHILAALAAVSLAAVGCGTAKSPKSSIPAVNQGGKIAIVAHRGFWKCEAGGMSQNSLAAFKAAQDAHLWGSECDINLTADGIVIVNHDGTINGKAIATHNFDDFKDDLLPNGERRPTLDQYLDQLAKCKTTKLIIELKKQPSEELETTLVEKTIECLKAHKLYSPKRVGFITFSPYMCKLLATRCPEFTNQFLTAKKTEENAPGVWFAEKVNGIDYQDKVFLKYPDWVKQAHDLGMSVNVWTVDKREVIEKMVELKVDQITTNEPLLAREILGNDEFLR